MQFVPNTTFAGEEKEEEVIFHPRKQTNRDKNGHISLKKGERERKYKGECDETRTEQKKKNRPTKKDEGKGHHGKDKGQRTKSKSKRTTQKRPSTTERDKLFFSPSPTPLEKYKPTFSPNVPSFRDFFPCFISNLPTPYKLPFNPTRRTRAYAYVRACALSEFAIFAFTLHLSAQQTVDQSLECEGKSCLHLHRNNLKFNTLHDFYCKKSVKVKW